MPPVVGGAPGGVVGGAYPSYDDQNWNENNGWDNQKVTFHKYKFIEIYYIPE